MAVNPLQNPEIVSINLELLELIEQHVDAKLKDGEWLKTWQCGPANAPYYGIAYTKNDMIEEQRHLANILKLHTSEKEELANRYGLVGWRKVEVSNSDDDGGPVGVIYIRLYV